MIRNPIRYWNIAIALSWLLICAPSAFAVNLVVSGFTNPTDANGIYAPIADLYGYKAWKLTTTTRSYYIYNRIYSSTDNVRYWNIDSTDTDDHNTVLFYATSSSASPATSLTWIKDVGEGAPIVVEQGAPVFPEINVLGNNGTLMKGDTSLSYARFTKFGAVNMASGNVTRSFTIQNLGAGILHISGVSIGGDNATDFTVTTSPAATVASTAITTVVITFDPSALGNRNATVTITSDDSDEGSYTFAIQGYGFTPSNIVLSGVTTPTAANGTYTYQGVLNNFEYWKNANGYYVYNQDYQNAGTRYWNIDANLVDTDPDYLFFNLSDAGTPVSMTGWTADTVTGHVATGVPFISEGTPIPEIDLQGNGVSIVSNDVTPSFTDQTNFGTIDISSTTKSRTRTFTIKNFGTASLTLSGASPYVAISGTNASDFSITTPPPSTVASSGSATFVVTFTPTTVGTKSATLTIINNDADEGTYKFNIQGDAITPKNLIVTGITTPVGQNGTYLYQGILNEFPYWKQGSYYIYNKQYLTSGRFWDIDTNTDDAHVSFYSSSAVDNASPVAVTSWTTESSSGCMGTPVLAFTEPEINVLGNVISIVDGDVTPALTDYTDFGSLAAASGTVVRTYTIQNTGIATLTLGTNAVSITGNTDFTVTAQPATSVAAGASTNFQVTFDAAAVGLRSAAISIVNNDPDENPYNFSIQGTGINTAPVATPPTAPVVAEDAVNIDLANDIQITDGDADNQTITFTITGGRLTLGATGITFGGSGNGTSNFTASGTLIAINTALDAATFTPTANLNGANVATIAFVTSDGTANSNTATVTFSISSVNDAPTFTAYSGVVATTAQNTEVQITLATLKALGDEADIDGTVDAFVVSAVSSGTLKIGTSANTATAFNASTNYTINATKNAYWTPASNLSGTQNAFTTLALDNNGASSTGAVLATVTVNDVTAPQVTSLVFSGTPAINATSVTYVVTFSEPVVNVSANDFVLTTTGTASGNVSSVTAISGTIFNVLVNGISGTGTIRLDLKASTDIADASANTPPAAYVSGVLHSVDLDGPTLTSSTPVNNTTGVAIADNLTFTFNENIVFGTGSIQIVNLDDAASTITIDAASPGAQASIDAKTLTVNPAANLNVDGHYSIQIAATALVDSYGNPFAGVADQRFTTIKTQTITFDALASKIYGDAAYTLSGTSNSGLTVSYASSDLDVATVSGNQVTIVGTGKTTITASQSGNGIYLAATDVSQDLTVAPKTLTIAGLSGVNKEYDGTNVAILSGTASLNGVVTGDAGNVSLSGSATAMFANKNVGDTKTTTVAGYSLSGSRKDQYTLTQPTGITANITNRPITVSGVSASNKVYDGTTVATLSGGTIDTVSGDIVTLNIGTGVFANKNIGTAMVVTASGYSITGPDAGNYTLTTQPTGITASITPYPITVTADAKSIQQGDDDVALTYSVDDLLGSDVITGALTREAGDTAGTYAILQGSLSAGSNYIITYHDANYVITEKPVFIDPVVPQLAFTGRANARIFNLQGVQVWSGVLDVNDGHVTMPNIGAGRWVVKFTSRK